MKEKKVLFNKESVFFFNFFDSGEVKNNFRNVYFFKN